MDSLFLRTGSPLELGYLNFFRNLDSLKLKRKAMGLPTLDRWAQHPKLPGLGEPPFFFVKVEQPNSRRFQSSFHIIVPNPPLLKCFSIPFSYCSFVFPLGTLGLNKIYILIFWIFYKFSLGQVSVKIRPVEIGTHVSCVLLWNTRSNPNS